MSAKYHHQKVDWQDQRNGGDMRGTDCFTRMTLKPKIRLRELIWLGNDANSATFDPEKKLSEY